MAKKILTKKEQELVSAHFEAKDFVALAADKPRHVYRATIRSANDSDAPLNTPVIFKFLTKQQAEIYRQVKEIHSPGIETIYDVYNGDTLSFSVSECISRPAGLKYRLIDSFPDSDGATLPLSQLVQYHHVFEEQVDALAHEAERQKTEREKSSQTSNSDQVCLPERTALKIAYILCKALKPMQEKGLTHGDLSPQNILFTDTPEGFDKDLPFSYDLPFIPKIIDFGTTKFKKKASHTVTSVVGTRNFVAPEILAYNKSNDRMDIYAIGCLLHYMCLGFPPGAHGANNSEELLSKGISQIIEKCNADYDSRYANLDLLIKDILRELRIAVNNFERVLYRVPGFRSRTPWKMAISGYFYISAVLSVVISFALKANPVDNVMLLVLCIAEIIVIFDVFQIEKRSQRLSETFRKHKYLRIAGRAVAALLVFAIYMCIDALIS